MAWSESANAGAILPEQLAALRLRNRWSLAELSARTGLSRPYLSRLESGARQPSLGALLMLARAYETTMAALLDGGAPASAWPTVMRSNRAQIQKSNGLRYRSISSPGISAHLSALRVTVPHQRRQTSLSAHDGEELLYVLSGTLRLVLGSERYTLEPGDSAHFDSRIPHHVSAAGPADVEILLAAAPARTKAVEDAPLGSAAPRVAREPVKAAPLERPAVICPALE